MCKSVGLLFLISALRLWSPAQGEAQVPSLGCWTDNGWDASCSPPVVHEVRRQVMPRAFFGASVALAEPVGDLGNFFNVGGGAQFEGGYGIALNRRLRLRGDLGFMIYGSEQRDYCEAHYGCRVELKLTTTNSYFFWGIGPEFVLMTGRFEPYVYSTVGSSHFLTNSELGEGEKKWGQTTNYSDGVLAFKMAGGMRVRVTRGKNPVSLDLGVDRHQNGIANFLTKGDILDHPDGSITIYSNRAAANLLMFRLGVTIGFGTN